MRHFSWTRSCPNLPQPAPACCFLPCSPSQARTHLLDAPPSVASVSRVLASPHRACLPCLVIPPALALSPSPLTPSLPKLSGWSSRRALGRSRFWRLPTTFYGGCPSKTKRARPPKPTVHQLPACARPPNPRNPRSSPRSLFSAVLSIHPSSSLFALPILPTPSGSFPNFLQISQGHSSPIRHYHSLSFRPDILSHQTPLEDPRYALRKGSWFQHSQTRGSLSCTRQTRTHTQRQETTHICGCLVRVRTPKPMSAMV